jgi:hypothetical protein
MEFSRTMQWKRRKRSTLKYAVLVATLACLAASIPATGCFEAHQCDPSSYDWYGGRITQDNTYETNAIDEPWLNYPGNATIRVHYPMDVGAAGWSITPLGYVALAQVPDAGPDAQPDALAGPVQVVEAPGQLAEYSDFNSQGFTVLNATCANYFARFTVHFETALDGAADPLDAGAGAD